MKLDGKIIEEHVKFEEYEKIVELLGREPNIVELGIFSAMWSEHCSYKSSKVHLKKFPTEAPWVVQGPGENAGVIMVDEETKTCAVFKVESHNHPSFIEPFHGSATGVGGILRDIFTMGARPVACMDSLRFGEPTDERTKYLVREVVAGISHYGNCVGVPTVGGEVYFDDCYKTNPLVNVFCLGLTTKDNLFYARAGGVGNPVIYVGARTGRDGIHGATMASEEFSSEEETEKKVNVQIGDPFLEKLLIEACLEAMKTGAVVAIQDMGAAGLTSSSAEMASRGKVGIELYLDKVPLREEGMTPYEIMVSESQERMLLAVEPGTEEEVIKISEKYGLPASVIGKTTDTKRIVAKYKGEVVVDLPLELLCEAPLLQREEKEDLKEKKDDKEKIKMPEDLNEVLLKLLESPNICSKEWIYQQYDHEVQIRTVVKPGKDAAVLRLVEAYPKGIALTADCNSTYCKLNPYVGAVNAVAESVRNLATVGAKPVAMLDNLNFGNPERPERFWQLKECLKVWQMLLSSLTSQLLEEM